MKLDYTTYLKTFFTNKSAFEKFTDEEKEKFFFMFNKYAAKATPNNAEAFNKKSVNKALAMDIWFEYFFNTKKVPSYFSISRKKKTNPYELSKVDYLILEKSIEEAEKIEVEKQKLNKSNLKIKKLKK